MLSFALLYPTGSNHVIISPSPKAYRFSRQLPTVSSTVAFLSIEALAKVVAKVDQPLTFSCESVNKIR